MTVKVSKKDRLSALRTMWEVLRQENLARPFNKQSSSFKLLLAVEVQLKDLLDLKTEGEPTVHRLDKESLQKITDLREEARILRETVQELSMKHKDFCTVTYNSLVEIVRLKKEAKLDEALEHAEKLLDDVGNSIIKDEGHILLKDEEQKKAQ